MFLKINDRSLYKKKNLSQIIYLQEISRVLEAGLEPARRLNAKGF